MSYLPPKSGQLEISARFKDGANLPGFPSEFFVSKDYNPERLEIKTIPDNNTFNEPYIAFPLKRTLLISDMKRNRVIEIRKGGGDSFELVRILNSANGVELLHPRGIAVNSMGEILIVDSGHNRILVLSSTEGVTKRTIGGMGQGVGGSGNKDGEFNKPRGILVLPDDRILVCDTENCRIQMFDKNGRHLMSVGSSGKQERQFAYPLNAAFSPSGKEIAISDSDNFRVQFFDLNLRYIGEIGKEEDPSRNKWKCDLLTPSGVAYDRTGNLIVSEMNGHRLKIFSAEKQLISTIDGSVGGNQDSEFNKPRGVSVDPEDGTIYVADTENKAIKLIH